MSNTFDDLHFKRVDDNLKIWIDGGASFDLVESFYSDGFVEKIADKISGKSHTYSSSPLLELSENESADGSDFW